jgi:hypothetical protein
MAKSKSTQSVAAKLLPDRKLLEVLSNPDFPFAAQLQIGELAPESPDTHGRIGAEQGSDKGERDRTARGDVMLGP